jgi:hypothetical protein
MLWHAYYMFRWPRHVRGVFPPFPFLLGGFHFFFLFFSFDDPELERRRAQSNASEAGGLTACQLCLFAITYSICKTFLFVEECNPPSSVVYRASTITCGNVGGVKTAGLKHCAGH